MPLPDGPGPVVVEVGELVGDALELLRLQPGVVVDDVVGGGVDGALAHALGHQVEVVPLGQRHHVVHHRAGLRVVDADATLATFCQTDRWTRLSADYTQKKNVRSMNKQSQ